MVRTHKKKGQGLESCLDIERAGPRRKKGLTNDNVNTRREKGGFCRDVRSAKK